MKKAIFFSADKLIKNRLVKCLRNLTLSVMAMGGISTAVRMWWQGRIPEVTRLNDLLGRFTKMT